MSAPPDDGAAAAEAPAPTDAPPSPSTKQKHAFKTRNMFTGGHDRGDERDTTASGGDLDETGKRGKAPLRP